MPLTFSAPNYIYLQVNRQCSRCMLDCYLKPDGESLSLKEAKEIVNMARKSKVFVILIDGGNVLNWDGIYELVDYIHGSRMMVGLIANGEISLKQVQKLTDAKPDMIQVPLEGPEEIHDEVRGEGNYKKTIEALRHLRKHRVEMHVGTTVFSRNLMYIRQTSNVLHELAIPHRLIRYIPLSGNGYLTPEENQKVLDITYDLRVNGKRRIILNNCYTFMRASKLRESLDLHTTLGCLAGKNSLAISAEGYITPCPMFSSKYIAEKIKAPLIWEDTLPSVWKEWDFLQLIRKPCSECITTCHSIDVEQCGGCRALSFYVYDSFERDPGCPF